MFTSGPALGAAFGFVMQRGRFYVTGFLYDIFTQHSWRGFVALLVVISVHAIGLAILTSAGMITPEYKGLAPLAVTVGDVISGLDIALAGGCASSTWYRSGEGLTGSWTTLVFYTLSAAAMKTGFLGGLQDALKDRTVGLTSIHASLGISIWPLVIALNALMVHLAVHYLREEFSGPRPVALAPCKTGLVHVPAEKAWHVHATAAIVGVLGVIAWPLSAATGRNDGLGITTPSSDLTNYVVTGDTERFDWGVLLVLGILVGSFIVAEASGKLRPHIPDAIQGARSVVGGTCTGVGAAWADGCTVGNGMVQTSLFSYQGWLASASIATGVIIAAKLQPKSSAPSLNDVLSTPSTTDDTATNDTAVSATTLVTSAATSLVSPPGSGGAGAADTETSPLAGAFAVAPVVLLDRSVVKQEDGKLKPLGDGRYELDTVSAVCPFPLIEAKDAIGKTEISGELMIPSDCTQATDVIPRWAAKDGHEVTNFEQTSEAGWAISVYRGR